MRPFERALEFDIEWPARWGRELLDIDDYPGLFPLNGPFVAEFNAKRARIEGARGNNDQQSLDENVPEGFVRGKDYQRCPNPKCHEAVSLIDGCNHIVCEYCSQHFCYICGNEALEGSQHWSRADGGCPRWNGANDANAHFDDDDDSVDDDDDSVDEEEEGGVRGGEWTPGVSFDTWTWNVTMQDANAETRALMHRVLQLPVENATQGPLSDVELEALVDAMLENRPQHGMTDQEWQALVELHHGVVARFLRTNFDFAQRDEFSTSHGVLTNPVGGVFNLSNENARQAAYEWAHQRRRAWTPANDNTALNYAIFDVGPGSLDDRFRASDLMNLLGNRGDFWGEMDFEAISTPFSESLLVKVTGWGLAHSEPVNGRLPERNNPLEGLVSLFLPRTDLAGPDAWHGHFFTAENGVRFRVVNLIPVDDLPAHDMDENIDAHGITGRIERRLHELDALAELSDLRESERRNAMDRLIQLGAPISDRAIRE